MDDLSKAFAHVTSCISSADDYKLNSQLVFKALARNSKVYTDGFLKVLAEIFSDAEYPPISKFLALYLLTKATELKDEFLIARLALHRPLLNELFTRSQIDRHKPIEEKGKSIFNKKPTAEDSIIGNHFIRLILEALVFWKQNYGSEDKKSPFHVYFIMYAVLAPRIGFSEEFIFFNKSDDILKKPYFHVSAD